jgi:competence protein ComEC
MKRLKNLLQYDASKYIHVAIIVALYIFSYKSYISIALLVIEVIYIFKKSKNILIYALVIVLIITIRISIVNNRDVSLPISGEVTEVYEHSFYMKNDGKILCYYYQASELEPGMIVEVHGETTSTKTYQIMNTFDYETYLLSENVKEVVSVDEIKIYGQDFSVNTIKYKIIKYIDRKYQEETASFLKLFLLGEKDEIFKQDSEKFSSLGISHIFAISGMHLGIIVGFLMFILKKFYISKETNRIIIVLFLIIYNIITGFKISIIRATLLLVGVFLKDFFKILLTKTDLLSFSFIGLLIYNPYFIYNVGFQLSYLIAFSVIMGDYLYKDDKLIKRMAKVTFFASLVSLPITLRINHSFGLVFVFANVFFILFVTYLFLPISFLLIIAPFLEPVYEIVLAIFTVSVDFFENINVIIDFNFTQVIYIIIYWFAIFVFITNKKEKRRTLALLSIILVFLLNIFVPFKSSCFVRFLDVSQGDAIHIHDNQCNMLIDTGDIDNYDTVLSYLEAYNIRSLDILVITHFHSDHYGEINDIVDDINIGRLYVNSSNQEIHHETITLDEGDNFACGESRFQVLSADTNSSNENNNSIVLYALIGDDRYLFAGDIESEIEKKLVDKYHFPVDILKVPHHGSATSSTQDFIKAANAKVGIISVGEYNQYSHPNDEVIARYSQNKYNIIRTDESGTITVYYYRLLNLRLIESYKKSKRLYYCIGCM